MPAAADKQEASPPRPQGAWRAQRLPRAGGRAGGWLVAGQTLLPTSPRGGVTCRPEAEGGGELAAHLCGLRSALPEARRPAWPFFPSVVTSSW